MQYTLDFDCDVPTKQKNINPQYIAEFKQGDFSNAIIQGALTQEEITETLISYDDTIESVKIDILIQIAKNISTIKEDIINKYLYYGIRTEDEIRKHNGNIRKRLKQRFEQTDTKILKKQGLDKWYKYNNYFWRQAGGLSLKRYVRIINENMFWLEYPNAHTEYTSTSRKYIQTCIKKVIQANITNKEKIKKYYIKIFGLENINDAINLMDISDNLKKNMLSIFN